MKNYIKIISLFLVLGMVFCIAALGNLVGKQSLTNFWNANWVDISSDEDPYDLI